jgi:hypothetical protein
MDELRTASGDPVPLSSFLPLDARLLLRRAAATPVVPGDEFERTKAINAAIARVRLLHPELFRVEALSPL